MPLLALFRPVVRGGIAVAGLLAVSGSASAHGAFDVGGPTASFTVVLGVPIVAGLVGGLLAVRGRRGAHDAGRTRRTGGLAVLLIGLGLVFALSAAGDGLLLTVAGVAVGVTVAVWLMRSSHHPGEARHAHLTFGAVCVHRILEGLVLGALYSTGAVIGLLGAAVLAGHTTLETAAVGGLYAARRTRAAGAVVLVQVGFAGGAVAGLLLTWTLPTPVRVLGLALAGGLLLGSGGVTLTRAFGVARDRRRGLDHDSQTGLQSD